MLSVRSSRVVALMFGFVILLPGRIRSQDTTRQESRALITVGSPLEDEARTAQLRTGPTAGWLLRAPSSLGWATTDGARLALVLPRVLAVHNSAIAYSLNDGALWAGRGTSASITGGGLARLGRVRIAILPELTTSANDPYRLADTLFAPRVPPSRSPFSSPWHAGAQSIDLPLRFGERALTRLGPGQSSIVVRAGAVELGAASENEWWGPGLRNALVLSNNAAGFPHLLLRTAAPVSTPVGSVEAHWLAGGLTESAFFDADPANDLRSIALLGVTLQPRGVSGLTIGMARAVYGRASGWGAALTAFPDVFRDVGQPDAVPMRDSVPTYGRDQLISLFARWLFPASGLEVYAEMGRSEFPVSLRDFLEQPNHTEGYTAGLQWLGGPVWRSGRVRLQAEATFIEQSTTYRFRPIGSWYTSHAVPQGYTERGQPLGAAIGPGASSQWFATDYMAGSWQVGGYFSRVRWLEDAHSQYPNERARCTHDVSLLPGVRGSTPSSSARAAVHRATSTIARSRSASRRRCSGADGPLDDPPQHRLHRVVARLAHDPLARAAAHARRGGGIAEDGVEGRGDRGHVAWRHHEAPSTR
jgi:hypothetical protein